VSRSTLPWLVSIVATVLLSLAACGGAADDACMPIVDGVVVSNGAIDVSIRNRAGRGEAIGAVVTASTATGTVNGRLGDTVHVFVGNGAGPFQVHVSKPFYRDTTISNVVVAGGTCGFGRTIALPVTIDLVAGAPPVRSVAVLGAGFLATPGDQLHLVPYFDADSGVSTAVTWQISDTTLARIDASGAVTAKCSVHGGADTVTATSVADPTVRGQAPIGIGVAAACP
jgi:hypothetical protein